MEFNHLPWKLIRWAFKIQIYMVIKPPFKKLLWYYKVTTFIIFKPILPLYQYKFTFLKILFLSIFIKISLHLIITKNYNTLLSFIRSSKFKLAWMGFYNQIYQPTLFQCVPLYNGLIKCAVRCSYNPFVIWLILTSWGFPN
jgi:uncharacterized membrane protein YjdF